MMSFLQFISEEIGDPFSLSNEVHPAPHGPYGDHTEPEGLIRLHGLVRAKATADKAPVTSVPLSRVRATNKFLGDKLGKTDAFPDHDAPVFAKVHGFHYTLDGHHRIAQAIKDGETHIDGHVYPIRRDER